MSIRFRQDANLAVSTATASSVTNRNHQQQQQQQSHASANTIAHLQGAAASSSTAATSKAVSRPKKSPPKTTSSGAAKKAQIKVKPFASHAHTMISRLTVEHPDVASWSDSGEMIVIRNKKEFTKLLPKFFNTDKYDSWSKQLNVYGFMRIHPQMDIKNGKLVARSTPTPGIRHNETYLRFWHPQFRRGHEELLIKILPVGHSSSGTSATGKRKSCAGTSKTNNKNEKQNAQTAEELRGRVKHLKKEICETKRQMEAKISTLENSYATSVSKLRQMLEEAIKKRLDEQRKAAQANARAVVTPIIPPVSESYNDIDDHEWDAMSDLDDLMDDPVLSLAPSEPPLPVSFELPSYDLCESILFEDEGLNDLMSLDLDKV